MKARALKREAQLAMSLREKAYTFLADATLTIVENDRLVLGTKEIESRLGRVGG
jgi:hypothetical protein